MRHLNFQYVRKSLVGSWSGFRETPPRPFPGRSSPTRIAWEITWGTVAWKKVPNKPPQPAIVAEYSRHYFGKPNKMQILCLERHIAECKKKGNLRLLRMWTAELDQAGVISWTKYGYAGGMSDAWGSHSYFAYHPQAGTVAKLTDPFLKPFYIKRIGGLSVYSHQRKLSAEQIDKYYAWYEGTFGKKLRRPKSQPMILGSAEVAEQ